MSSKKCQNPFSPQQKQILKYLIAGLDNRKIVAKTGLSETELKKELQKIYSDDFIAKHIRKHLLWYLGGKFNAKTFKERAIKVQSVDEIKNLVNEFFD